jgi:hypothetical protein
MPSIKLRQRLLVHAVDNVVVDVEDVMAVEAVRAVVMVAALDALVVEAVMVSV